MPNKNVFFGDYIGIDARRGRVVIAYMNTQASGNLGISSSVFDFRPGTTELETDEERGNGSEPDQIAVQHILIGFEGSVPGKEITRTREEAETLAKRLLKEAREGKDFDEMVRTHTDDSHPGIYQMANFHSQPDMTATEPAEMVFPRAGMVAAFGDTGFPLDVGEIGLANYDPVTSKYGWHIIKRIR